MPLPYSFVHDENQDQTSNDPCHIAFHERHTQDQAEVFLSVLVHTRDYFLANEQRTRLLFQDY